MRIKHAVCFGIYRYLIFPSCGHDGVAQGWFRANLLWFNSDIITCRYEYHIVKTSSEVMKTHEVINKMEFRVFKKCNFLSIICEVTAKTRFLKIISRIHETKRENVFEKLNHISFNTWALTETQIFMFFSVGPQEDWTTKFLSFTCFCKVGWRFELCASKLKYLTNFRKKLKTYRAIVILNLSKISAVELLFRGNQRCWALNQHCLRETQRCSALILGSENFRFQRFSELKQTWNYSESELRMSLRRQSR